MNDSEDPLEDMLRQFRPRSLSAARRQQVAERIAATPRRRLVTTSLGALAAAVAACLLVAMFFHGDSPSPEVHSENHDAEPEGNHGVPVADAMAPREQHAPTLWAYRRAADGSLEELDSLLVRHAQELLAPEQRSIVSLQQRFP